VKLLVTGASGFLGGDVCAELGRRGHDVVAMVRRWFAREICGRLRQPGRFAVDDEPIRYRDFVSLTAQALGVGRPRTVPVWLARLAADPDPVRAVVRSARSSNARIKAELGWSPRFPTSELGVPEAVRHLAAG
jgi:nucleoside-diphosphate-sugar epimerase